MCSISRRNARSRRKANIEEGEERGKKKEARGKRKEARGERKEAGA
jgi:hypothetical protein